MALDLKIEFRDIPDTNEIHEKLQDARLRTIKEEIQEAANRGDSYCWVSDKILDKEMQKILEEKGYVLTYNFSDYQISW
nr:MAG TPA: hypothetical protein [Caudoviricetes sp.]